jgi:hypothetical protein
MSEAQRKAKFFSLMRRFNQLGAMLDRSLDVGDATLSNAKSIVADMNRTQALIEEIIALERGIRS